ncbi:MAG TPA: DUF58 domain-containing protein [Rhizomicrobium sp.]|nr:DUF58 domain-containing protein [Rhizomicrobium sp.]
MIDRERSHPLQDEAESLASALPPLLVAAERLSSAVSLGVHGRRKSGMGETFWQFRRYRAEDASTAIDWRQSAKSQHLFVREREWEAAEAVWFWRDASAGMDFKSAASNVTKLERANVLLLALASLLVRGGERIALLGDGRPPATGRAPIRRIAHELLLPGAEDTLPPDAPLTKNAQFVWISDFLSPFGDIENVLRRIAGQGLGGHLIHIIDPAEEEFPYQGRVRFDAPGGKVSEILGRAESAREAYRAKFKAHADTLAELARRLGWTYMAHRTDHSPQTALVALYMNLGGARKAHT